MIFNVQRYSIHDGPGIRTVVFFKGCSLNCAWCSNPESISPLPQLFYTQAKCCFCGNCVRAAPDSGVRFAGDKKLRIDFAALNAGDLSWARCCPTKAMEVKGKSVAADELLALVMRDEIYYRQSGGGLTLSGGEALLQNDFAEALLRGVREENISTAVETAGQVPAQNIIQVAPWVSLFLFDLKLLDGQKHRNFIGRHNKLIQKNLAMLSEIHDNVLVRMPVIPGVNDDEKSLSEVMDFLDNIRLKRLALLPFHQYGSHKYEAIGKAYPFFGVDPPDEARLEELRDMLVKRGFESD